MEKLKPIEQIADDAEKYDLVRINLEGGSKYTGHFCGNICSDEIGIIAFRSIIPEDISPDVALLNIRNRDLQLNGVNFKVVDYKIVERYKEQ